MQLMQDIYSGIEDIRMEKRVRQMMDVLELASVDVESNEKKALALYKVLTSDYVGAEHSDVLKIIEYVNSKKMSLRGSDIEKYFLGLLSLLIFKCLINSA